MMNVLEYFDSQRPAAAKPRSPKQLTGWLIAALCFALSLPAAGASLDGKTRLLIERSRIVSSDVIHSLESAGQVGIRVALADDADKASSPEVSQAVIDLMQIFLPGEATLDDRNTLSGRVDTQGLLAVLQHPAVLDVDLAEGPAAVTAAGSFVCIPSSNAACLSGKFRVQVNGPFGPFAGVAASSKQSAAFYFTSFPNWEVMVKVLNGCGVNNHYWVFAGHATSQSFSISVLDVTTGQARTYNNPSCPVTDTTAFSCS